MFRFLSVKNILKEYSIFKIYEKILEFIWR